jgi:hypothetical protein
MNGGKGSKGRLTSSRKERPDVSMHGRVLIQRYDPSQMQVTSECLEGIGAHKHCSRRETRLLRLMELVVRAPKGTPLRCKVFEYGSDEMH